MYWLYERQFGRKKDNEPLQWDCFSYEDSAKLETAFKESQKEPVFVGTDELYQVDLSSLSLTPVYWRSEPLQVRRAFWFEKSFSKDSWHPSMHSENLESFFASMSLDGENLEFELDSNLRVKFECNSNQSKAKASDGMEFFRGINPEFEKISSLIYSKITSFQSSESDSEIKKHLVLFIHGVGQKFFSKRNRSIPTVTDLLRERFREFSHSRWDVEKKSLQIIPIQWRLHLKFLEDQTSESDFDSFVERISLPSIPTIRQILTDLSLDVLLYMSPEHYQMIMNYLIQEINRVYGIFIARNPSFTGKVSLLGHSLGSVLAFDLLACELNGTKNGSNSSKLAFKVDKFWAIGSPLGMFLLLKGFDLKGTRSGLSDHPASEAMKKERFLDCNEFYNIFHPNDPCAFRIEPLLRSEFQSIVPQKVKEFISKLQSSDSKWEKSFFSIFQKQPLDKVDDKNELFCAFNPAGRLDFELSEKMLEYSYFSMLFVHNSYWEDEEICRFLWFSC